MAQIFEKCLIAVITAVIVLGLSNLVYASLQSFSEQAIRILCEEVANKAQESAYRAWILNKEVEFTIVTSHPLSLRVEGKILSVSSNNYTAVRILPVFSEEFTLNCTNISRVTVLYGNGRLYWREG